MQNRFPLASDQKTKLKSTVAILLLKGWTLDDIRDVMYASAYDRLVELVGTPEPTLLEGIYKQLDYDLATAAGYVGQAN